MYSKIHKVRNSVVLACCEKELLGKTLEEGDYCLEIKDKFYKDMLVDENELARLLGEADNINLLGEKPVRIAMKQGLVSERDVIRINNVPHVNIFKI